MDPFYVWILGSSELQMVTLCYVGWNAECKHPCHKNQWLTLTAVQHNIVRSKMFVKIQ